MNLNEVKKHIFFQISLYILIGICLLLSLFAILITPAKAQEQTTDITSTIKSNYDCPFGYNSSGYCAIQTDNGGGVRSFNTRYNGVLNSIGFAFPYYFHQNSNNEIIDIYSTSNDFRNNNINVYCYSYESSPTQSNTRSCSLRFISQKHIQVIFPYDSLQWHEIILASNNAITGVSNYLIQKVTLTYDDGQQDLTGIIDNATTNTTDIINNNNSNSEQTQNVIIAMNEKIMSQIGDICPNRANWPYSEDNKVTIEAIHHDTVLETGQTINLTAGVKYYFSYERSCTGTCENGQEAPFDVLLMYNSGYAYFIAQQSKAFQFTPERSGSYELRLDCNINGDVCSYWNFYIGTVGHNYCPYGSYISKIDWVGNTLSVLGLTQEEIKEIQESIQETQESIKDTQQQQYDYLTDDTDPSVNQSGINNVLGSVNVQDPLNYLLTLPLNLLTKLNTVISSGTCSRASFGELFGTELYLPCINFENYLGSSLWGTIDTIVGIGLLAIILKKFYDTISNILSLGKEEEIRKGMELPTPMEFFAQILGGGR